MGEEKEAGAAERVLKRGEEACMTRRVSLRGGGKPQEPKTPVEKALPGLATRSAGKRRLSLEAAKALKGRKMAQKQTAPEAAAMATTTGEGEVKGDALMRCDN